MSLRPVIDFVTTASRRVRGSTSSVSALCGPSSYQRRNVVAVSTAARPRCLVETAGSGTRWRAIEGRSRLLSPMSANHSAGRPRSSGACAMSSQSTAVTPESVYREDAAALVDGGVPSGVPAVVVDEEHAGGPLAGGDPADLVEAAVGEPAQSGGRGGAGDRRSNEHRGENDDGDRGAFHSPSLPVS